MTTAPGISGSWTTARPLQLPRRKPVPLIVTGRHQRYRVQTAAWLDRHRIQVERLVMRDWEWGAGGFDREAVARFKADRLRETQLPYFAESDPWQAARIADLSGRRVICPAAGRVLLPPKAPPVATVPPPPTVPPPRPSIRSQHDEIQAALACPHRTKCGCNAADCAAGKGPAESPNRVDLDWCRRCPETRARLEATA